MTLGAEKKPAPTDWHKADIIAALHKRGWSLTQLGVAHNYGPSGALTQALHRPYPRAEAIIAEALGMTHPSEIWPSRYGPDGKPNRQRGRPAMKGTVASVAPAKGPRNLQSASGA
jgi:Ner family transcriptional regulator